MSSDLYLIKRRVDFNAGLSRWHVMTTSFVTAVARHMGTAMLYHGEDSAAVQNNFKNTTIYSSFLYYADVTICKCIHYYFFIITYS